MSAGPSERIHPGGQAGTGTSLYLVIPGLTRDLVNRYKDSCLRRNDTPFCLPSRFIGTGAWLSQG